MPEADIAAWARTRRTHFSFQTQFVPGDTVWFVDDCDTGLYRVRGAVVDELRVIVAVVDGRMTLEVTTLVGSIQRHVNELFLSATEEGAIAAFREHWHLHPHRKRFGAQNGEEPECPTVWGPLP